MKTPIIKINILSEQDIVQARQLARHIAKLIGFDIQNQTVIATAVSEIARNTYTYARTGKVEFLLDDTGKDVMLLIYFVDQGPGIKNLKSVLDGKYVSKKGLGMGLIGARRLMDYFEIKSEPGKGTTIILGKKIPFIKQRFGKSDITALCDKLAQYSPQVSLEEIKEQNQEYAQLLDELRKKEDELIEMNRELEETNKGMIALHSEIEKKNMRLKEASRLKSQFLANMSHELRSPLNSIIGFTGIVLQGIAGELNEEQKKQLSMVYESSKHLLNLINDILDLSKIEAQKITINYGSVNINELIKMVGKMVSPMVEEKGLYFKTEIAVNIPESIYGDRNRIKQILINLLVNSVKFTERGEICLSCTPSENKKSILFAVRDTGIGIKKEDLETIFDSFTQIETVKKDKPQGTGLGLAISKKMVEMMGGKIWVESRYGKGAQFYFTIPVSAPSQKEPQKKPTLKIEEPEPGKKLILTIDDEKQSQEILKIYLKEAGYEVIQAYNAKEALELARKYNPFAITLDIIMPGRDGWEILGQLKQNSQTKDIPIICISILDNRELGISLGAIEYLVKPVNREQLINELRRLEKQFNIQDILIVDDNPKDVNLLNEYLKEYKNYNLTNAYGGKEGLQKIKKEKPDLILLDLMMPEMDGFEVIRRLKEKNDTKYIPIIIITAKDLDKEERDYLNSKIEGIIRKGKFNKQRLLKDIVSIMQEIEIKSERSKK